MELENDFTVPVPKAQAWAVLMDVERVAPCMPGATFDGYEDDGFKGRVKVKLGPITVTYNGKARFVETDEAAGVAVIEAAGKEARGPGTAAATIRARMEEQGDSTKVSVVTDLNITGKPAQFGRGVMAEVAGKLVGQFADCLASQLAAGPLVDDAASTVGEAAATEASGAYEPAAAGSAPPSAASAAPPAAAVEQPRPTADAIDLIDTAGAPVLKRVLPVLAGIVALLLVWRLLRRGSR
jgi:carbon monoxide dehydrogenase subunit G